MNASKILQQLMQQAGGSQKGGSSSGVDVKGMLSGLSNSWAVVVVKAAAHPAALMSKACWVAVPWAC